MRSVTFRLLDDDGGRPVRADPIERLLDLLAGRRFAVLAGAGCSTDSGIPDYRGKSGTLRRRQPIQYQEFLRSEAARQRYWARSTIGFGLLSAARPNPAHLALAALEGAGRLTGLITQNVDGLHQLAGSQRIVELHGSLGWVRCLGCGRRDRRAVLQRELLSLNPPLASVLAVAAPDGDAELDPTLYSDFRVPACPDCGGMLKPDVVFFGENVARAVVDAAWEVLREAEALLVVGSSLAVYSGFRFVRGAAERGLPIAIVNLGPTRGDELAAVRVSAPVGPVLTTLASG